LTDDIVGRIPIIGLFSRWPDVSVLSISNQLPSILSRAYKSNKMTQLLVGLYKLGHIENSGDS
jgi:hypothetical protein